MPDGRPTLAWENGDLGAYAHCHDLKQAVEYVKGLIPDVDGLVTDEELAEALDGVWNGKISSSNVSDCNNVTASGIYRISQGTQNIPTDMSPTSAGLLIVSDLLTNTPYHLQIIINFTNVGMWVRYGSSSSSSSYYPWHKVGPADLTGYLQGALYDHGASDANAATTPGLYQCFPTTQNIPSSSSSYKSFLLVANYVDINNNNNIVQQVWFSCNSSIDVPPVQCRSSETGGSTWAAWTPAYTIPSGYLFGGSPLSYVQDLNNATTPNIYVVYNDSLNAPGDTQHAGVVLVCANGDYVYQNLFNYNGHFYSRVNTGSGWTTWAEVGSSTSPNLLPDYPAGASAQLTASTIDSAVTPGFYYATAGTVPGITDGTAAVLVVRIAGQAQMVVQLVWSGNAMYMRRCNNANFPEWTSWVEVGGGGSTEPVSWFTNLSVGGGSLNYSQVPATVYTDNGVCRATGMFRPNDTGQFVFPFNVTGTFDTSATYSVSWNCAYFDVTDGTTANDNANYSGGITATSNNINYPAADRGTFDQLQADHTYWFSFTATVSAS